MKKLLISLMTIGALFSIPIVVSLLSDDPPESPLQVAAPETLPSPVEIPSPPPVEEVAYTDDSAKILQNAFNTRRSNLQIRGKAEVYRVLPDDNKGSRHQRFLLRTSTGQSILVAHNIDLAPRIPGIKPGDTVEFYGVYEYNDKGGVIHWTHHDPGGRHEGGWLHHNGYTYQ